MIIITDNNYGIQYTSTRMSCPCIYDASTRIHTGLCDITNYLLTNGTSVFHVSTNSTDLEGTQSEVLVLDHFIPSNICGQWFEKCSTATLINGNGIVSLVPLNGSVGLVLHNSGNVNGDLQQHTLSPENLEDRDCMFISFVQIATNQRNEAVGYCIKSGILRTFDIIVNFESLNLSTIQFRSIDGTYSLGISATWTNFIHFDNYPGDSCFSTELPHTFFLVNNVLIVHIVGDRIIDQIGTIGTSMMCTKLKRSGECELAAYCGREVFTFSIHEDDRDNFASTLFPLTADDGFVLLCSPSYRYFVYIWNNTLTLYNRSWTTLSPLGDPFYTQFDADYITQSDCQDSETEPTAFVVNLQGTNSSVFLYRITLIQQDSSTPRVNITNLTSTYLVNSGSTGSDSPMISAQTGSQYAIISNGTDTWIYNWTLPCDESPLSIESAFTFVSFYITGSTYQCRCPIPESDPTTTSMSTIPVTTNSPMTTSTLTTSSPSTPSTSPGSSSGNLLIAIIISCLLSGVCVILFVVVLIIVCIRRKK